jgi:UDP-N-acetyl-D-mannosaminuronate dehydrogenase
MLKRIKTVIGGKSIKDAKSQDELYNSISEILCSIVSTSKIKELIKSELTIHRK